MPSDDLETMITRKELMQHLRVGKQAIKNYEAQGMPVERLGRGTPERRPVRYYLSRVLAWLAEQPDAPAPTAAAGGGPVAEDRGFIDLSGP